MANENIVGQVEDLLNRYQTALAKATGLIELKDQLIELQKPVNTLNNSIGGVTTTVNTISGIITTIKALPFPVAVAGVGIPANILTIYSATLDSMDKLLSVAKSNLKTIPKAISIMAKTLNTTIEKVNELALVLPPLLTFLQLTKSIVELQDNCPNITQASLDDVKNDLFNNTWGDIYLKTEPYADTYFSLVTETVYLYPYSFRTEKIWKPVSIGHPFIVIANRGYYKDLHNLGFKTFGHLIDESFDQIDNDQQRIERTAEIIEYLCRQDLASFLSECLEVCKYNQQHFVEMAFRTQQEFPERFDQFTKQYY